MAKLQAQAVKEFTDTELFEKLAATKDELFHLRFQHATGQLDKTSQLGALKKDIARLNTELRARELAAAETLAAQEESTR